jgi:hypothetical protein
MVAAAEGVKRKSCKRYASGVVEDQPFAAAGDAEPHATQ